MQMKKSVIVFLISVMVVFASYPAVAGTLSVNVTDLESITHEITRDGRIIFNGPDIRFLSLPGEPDLPYRSVKILLPPQADTKTLEVSINVSTESSVISNVDVAPVMPPVTKKVSVAGESWTDRGNGLSLLNTDIYGRDELFPADWIKTPVAGQIRQMKVVEIPLCLYRYNPVKRELYKLSSAVINVDYDSVSNYLSSSVFPSGRDRIASAMARKTVANFDSMAESYGILPSDELRSSSLYAAGYAIITTSEIIQNSSKLQNFIEWKNMNGYNVHLVSENEWGGGSGDSAAENIRSWLKNNYLDLDLKYALLIGNPHPESGNVPMKMTWPRKNAEEYTETDDFIQSPTDLYYADLNGNWDQDNDGYYGEGDDDLSGIDFNWDIYVGRIPFYGSFSVLDSILLKTMSYENQSEEMAQWRKNVLLPMVPSDPETFGYHLGEAIKDDLLPEDWSYYRIYEKNYDGLEPAVEKTPSTVDNVKTAWNNGNYGSVVWWTHGSSTSADDVMDSGTASSLDNSRPSVVFQVSCLNGYPEVQDNLSFALLKNGAVASVGASRISWYQSEQTSFGRSFSNADIAYRFTSGFVKEGMTTGEALFSSKATKPGIPEWWMNYTDFNLYGDPSLIILDRPDVDLTAVRGRIVQNDGNPLPGATVTVEGELAKRVVSTGLDGSFYTEVLSGAYEVFAQKDQWNINPDILSVNVNGQEVYIEGFVAVPQEKTSTTEDSVTATSGGGGGGGCNMAHYHLSGLILLLPLLVLASGRLLKRK